MPRSYSELERLRGRLTNHLCRLHDRARLILIRRHDGTVEMFYKFPPEVEEEVEYTTGLISYINARIAQEVKRGY